VRNVTRTDGAAKEGVGAGGDMVGGAGGGAVEEASVGPSAQAGVRNGVPKKRAKLVKRFLQLLARTVSR
jgi:hypothetical protein